jgi:hypothetical protein
MAANRNELGVCAVSLANLVGPMMQIGRSAFPVEELMAITL